MIDHDSDGFIDKEDLKDMLASLGKLYDDAVKHQNSGIVLIIRTESN